MRFVGWALGILLCTLSASAQTNVGELRLRIVDPTGASAHARVELISEANQFRSEAETDGNGAIGFSRLPFGMYRLIVFSTTYKECSEQIEIRSAMPLEKRISLSLAPVQTTVEVDDGDTLLDPYRPDSSIRINTSALASRTSPQPGRALIDLVSSQAGWLLEANGVLHPRGSEYQVQYVIDGVPLTDNRSPAFTPNIEGSDIESAAVLTGSFPAEFGRKLGGVIEIDTKRDVRRGFHGQVGVSGGSFNTALGSTALQYGWGRQSIGLSAEGARTDRYLDPPTLENFSNRGTLGNVSGRYDADLTENDRLGISVRRGMARFAVPNELFQQESGQYQARDSFETIGIASYRHIFSPNVLADFRVMGRELTAGLWSNENATPIDVSQRRVYREGYLKAAVSVHRRAHEWKFGYEGSLGREHERLNYSITDPERFDDEVPQQFAFSGSAPIREHALFADDLVRMGLWTVNAGMRWDRYKFLGRESAFSPRIAISRYFPAWDLVAHATYNRVFQTPAIENLLVASTAFEDSEFARLPVKASRGNFYEVGVSKAIGGELRVDANVFRRNMNHYADDDVLLNTGVSFPIAFANATIYGAETRIAVPRWKKFSGEFSYSYLFGKGSLPITGGLLLDDEALEQVRERGEFAISQDQRNTLRARIRYDATSRFWTGMTLSYNSGLPVEIEGDADDAAQGYDPKILARVNFERGRVRPSHSIDVSAGVLMYKHEQREIRMQGYVLNLTNRLNVVNFAGLLSGTAIAPPRSFTVKWQMAF